MDLWTHFKGQKYHVMGLTITDPEMVRRSRNVTVSCVALALIFLATSVIEYTANNQIVPTLLGLGSSLAAPAFGYLGARRGSATLMSLFIALMIVNALISGMFVVALLTMAPNSNWRAVLVVYALLWVSGGSLSAWAAYNGNKFFVKLIEGEQVVDNEMGAATIDSELPVFEEVGRKRIFGDLPGESLKADKQNE